MTDPTTQPDYASPEAPGYFFDHHAQPKKRQPLWALITVPILAAFLLGVIVYASLATVGYNTQVDKAKAYSAEVKGVKADLDKATSDLEAARASVSTCQDNQRHYLSSLSLMNQAYQSLVTGSKAALGGDYSTGTVYIQNSNTEIQNATSELQQVNAGGC